ncbi:hypothetical protein GA0004734_00016050 [Rhizobium sp. 9140]|nr:hypothetical protein GA0004734_00016050 [Rhizobium sp. 9140]
MEQPSGGTEREVFEVILDGMAHQAGAIVRFGVMDARKHVTRWYGRALT